MEREELAFRLVELYVNQIADSQEKRRMGLDTIMNAYFYALLRLTRKEKEMQAFEKALSKEEKVFYAGEKHPKEEPEHTVKPEDLGEEGTEEFKFD
jgi:hypothetical protein